MSEDIVTPPLLQEMEEQLQNRFKDYLLVATDGVEVYCLNSSNTAGIGLGRYATLLAEHALVTHV